MSKPPTEDENCLIVYDSEGEELKRFDFKKLELHPALTRAFKRAFHVTFGHTACASQTSYWASLRKFARMLGERGLGGATPLPANVALSFRDWLEGQDRGSSAKQSELNNVVAMLEFCDRNSVGVLHKRTDLVMPPFAPDEPSPRPKTLEKHELKLILDACYREIEATEKKLELGRRLRMKEAKSADERVLSALIEDLLAAGKGSIPTQQVIGRSRNSLATRVVRAGGLTEVLSLLWLRPEGVFPFYLAILLQTSGNPAPIADLRRDCIRQHPLRSDVESLVWDKPRAKRQQRADFPAGKEWSATALARRVAALNEGLVPHCRPRDRKKLFICLRKKPRSAGDCALSYHSLRRRFIERHQLKPFQFSDLRRAGALAHHLSEGGIESARRRLNHRSSRTTFLYTPLKDRSTAHENVIRHYQGKLVAAAKEAVSAVEGTTPSGGSNGPYETVFGFSCADPMSGTAPGSKAGATCSQFFRCATCPGAVVALDDEVIVARLVAAAAALTEAKERAVREGWLDRYREIYEPTQRVICTELLPAVEKGLLERVSRPRASNLPWLE